MSKQIVLLASNSSLSTRVEKATIDIPDDSSAFVLGRGVDLRSFFDPEPMPTSPFLSDKPEPKFAQDIVESVVQDFTDFSEDADEETRAISMYLNFKAKFGLSNFKAAFSVARTEKNTSKTVVATIVQKKSGPFIKSSQLDWGRGPTTETIRNPSKRRQAFFEKYGTHYITSIEYGYRFEILATCHTTDTDEQANFQAAFSSSAFKGEGGARIKKTLSKSNIEMYCKVFSRGVFDKNGQRINVPVLTGFDEISDFLKKYNKGLIRIKNAPISCSVKSYRSTLDNFPQTKAIFDPVDNLLTVTFSTRFPFTTIQVDKPAKFVFSPTFDSSPLSEGGTFDNQRIHFGRPKEAGERSISVDITSPTGSADIRIQTGEPEGGTIIAETANDRLSLVHNEHTIFDLNSRD